MSISAMTSEMEKQVNECHIVTLKCEICQKDFWHIQNYSVFKLIVKEFKAHLKTHGVKLQ